MADARPVSLVGRIASLPFIAVIWAYRVTLSPLVGGQCRFEPTCSRYGLEAYRLHGPLRGTALTARRVLRCNPFVKGGYDPVPIPDSQRRKPEPQPDAAESPTL